MSGNCKQDEHNNNKIVCNVVQEAFASASKSAKYEDVRQEFPFEAVEFLLHKLAVSVKDRGTDRHVTILELGCGTGKFTRVMLEVVRGKNVKVIATEPVESMCEQFRQVLPDTEIIQCAAEKIRCTR